MSLPVWLGVGLASSVVAAAEEEVVRGVHAPILQRVDAWRAEGQPASLTEDRVLASEVLSRWIAERARMKQPAHLVFVCTHNSRRSQMGQAWGQAAAMALGLDHVTTWSGGTEATAFNPRAVTALRAHGFGIVDTKERRAAGNPVYALSVGPQHSQEAFSKVYTDAFNPQSGFAAIMVCSSADASCPYVEGADLRVSLPYLDPKSSDDSPDEAATYAAKSEEIGREMVWIMSEAKRLR